ncbi:MAG TPA: helix-turn-helix transcriptional regulator, partial [Pseudomonadales bacterium]|nr:helix-turn-helix transcriptional regulator [Pseudomonadales bacterium]
CEKEEALSGLESSRLLARAQNAMVLGVKGYPSLEELSKMLNMTPRTLRRKLQLEGSKYSQLLEESRRRDAVKLLDNRNLEVQKVAELLGYADPANFTRAFRQWTGQTPSEYRVTRNN